ncbi:MAG: RDD family protein [Acidimicrobiaceae bacterium]|nr:RDD family protein [Acidimicrobiaceae bacterium]MDB4103054.1 RDD family protein [Acidimicrobiales bacterium]HAY67411.1 hypothetical protein [Acidimicrobiaceae bacterium]
MSETPSTPPGWYAAPGDPAGTHRYWDGVAWQGGPQPIQDAPAAAGGGMTAHGQRLATAGQRIGARLIDTVIMVIIVIAILAAIFGSGIGEFNAGVLILGIAFSFAYEAAMVALKGGSLGKLILGLAVVREDSGLTPPGWEPAIMRWIPGLAGNVPVIGPLISLVVFVLSLIWLFNDPKRQTVYDRIAKTQVIQTK